MLCTGTLVMGHHGWITVYKNNKFLLILSLNSDTEITKYKIEILVRKWSTVTKSHARSPGVLCLTCLDGVLVFIYLHIGLSFVWNFLFCRLPICWLPTWKLLLLWQWWLWYVWAWNWVHLPMSVWQHNDLWRRLEKRGVSSSESQWNGTLPRYVV